MDYRKFLGAKETRVLPYLGGPRVDAPDRSLRVEAELEPGWWRFQIAGRTATAEARAEPPDLSDLPAVRGHLLGDRLVQSGGQAPHVHLMPAEEAPAFAPAIARRWHGGALLFDSLEFESGVEEEVRRAREDGRSLADVKSVPASLRAAFALAIAGDVGRRLAIPASPLELRPHLSNLAQVGTPEAERVLRALERERQLFIAAQRGRAVSARTAFDTIQHVRDMRPPPEPHVRAERALERAGARLRRLRQLEHGLLEVVYDFLDESFITLVNAETLQVVDAGICLAGADDEVTLESLPSVIREAIQGGVLVITRHDA